MEEPNWADEKYDRQDYTPKKDDVVWVTKKTRGRFGPLDVAQPGDYGLVIGSWTSAMGSHKVSILTPDLQQLATTSSCVKIFTALSDDETWRDIKTEWMNKTYVPVIVVKKQTKRTLRRSQPHSKWVMTRNGEAVLVRGLSSDVQVWLSYDKIHPNDWDVLKDERSQCCSVRIPQWLALKSGLV